MTMISIINLLRKERYNAENICGTRADKKGKQTLSLPLWPCMTEKMIDAVIQAVKETGEKFHV